MSHMYKSIIHGNAIIWAEKGRRQPWPVSNLTFKNQRQKLCSGLILFLKIFAMDAILLTSDCYKKLLFLSHLKGILVRFWTKLNGFTATSHRCPTCCSYNCRALEHRWRLTGLKANQKDLCCWAERCSETKIIAKGQTLTWGMNFRNWEYKWWRDFFVASRTHWKWFLSSSVE